MLILGGWKGSWCCYTPSCLLLTTFAEVCLRNGLAGVTFVYMTTELVWGLKHTSSHCLSKRANFCWCWMSISTVSEGLVDPLRTEVEPINTSIFVLQCSLGFNTCGGKGWISMWHNVWHRHFITWHVGLTRQGWGDWRDMTCFFYCILAGIASN